MWNVFLILIFAERRRIRRHTVLSFFYSLLLWCMTSSRTQKSVVEVHLAQNRKKCARRDCPALQQSLNIVAKTVCLQQLCLIQLVWVDTQRSIHILFSFLFRNNSTESMVRGPYLGPSFFWGKKTQIDPKSTVHYLLFLEYEIKMYNFPSTINSQTRTNGEEDRQNAWLNVEHQLTQCAWDDNCTSSRTQSKKVCETTAPPLPNYLQSNRLWSQRLWEYKLTIHVEV